MPKYISTKNCPLANNISSDVITKVSFSALSSKGSNLVNFILTSFSTEKDEFYERTLNWRMVEMNALDWNRIFDITWERQINIKYAINNYKIGEHWNVYERL